MSLFEQTEEDLKSFHQLAGKFWKSIPDEAWSKRTGSRDKDWTLHELLAHLLSIAIIFNKAADAAIRGENLELRNFSVRDDLAAWNAEEIARLSKAPPNALIVQLLHEWQAAAEKARSLTEETATSTYHLPIYNRSASALDYIDWQLSHAGVIHGAQVTRPLGIAPLWTSYHPDFTNRILGRFIRHWSVAYWNDVHGTAPIGLNFFIDGAAGGTWHLIAAADGGSAGEGRIDADFEFYYQSADLFFSLFTMEFPISVALSSGRLRVNGDAETGLALLRRFSASRPKL